MRTAQRATAVAVALAAGAAGLSGSPAQAADAAGRPTAADLRAQVATAYSQWALAAVQAPAAWTVTRGAGVTIAVVDSGVDGTHPDLAAAMTAGYDVVTGTELRAGTDSDLIGHGTHVAGIIAAADDGKGISGIAPAAHIMPVRALSNQGGTADDIVNAIQWAVEHGADVINLSLGGPSDNPVSGTGAICDAIAAATARNVVVVAAAGNEASADNPLNVPAACPGVISVAAIDPRLQPTYFSSFDATVTVAAPGESLTSTVPTRADVEMGSPSGYLPASGTSMATPVVSGIAALYLSIHPGASVAEVRQAITGTARDIAVVGHDAYTGYGLVDAAAVVGAVGAPSPLEELRSAAQSLAGPSLRSLHYAARTAHITVAPVPWTPVTGHRVQVLDLVTGSVSQALLSGAAVRAVITDLPDSYLLARAVADLPDGTTLVGAWAPLQTPWWFSEKSRTLPPAPPRQPKQRVTHLSARWTDDGLEVTYRLARKATFALYVAFGRGWASHKAVPVASKSGVLRIPLDRFAPARATAPRVTLRLAHTSASATTAAQYPLTIVAARAGDSHFSVHGTAVNACVTRCGGQRITVHVGTRAVGRTLIDASGRYSVILPDDALASPGRIWVSGLSSRSLPVPAPGSA